MAWQDVAVAPLRPGTYRWSQVVGRVDTYALLAPDGTVAATFWPEYGVTLPANIYSHLTELAWQLNDDATLPLCRSCHVDSAERGRDLCRGCREDNRPSPVHPDTPDVA